MRLYMLCCTPVALAELYVCVSLFNLRVHNEAVSQASKRVFDVTGLHHHRIDKQKGETTNEGGHCRIPSKQGS